MAAVGFRKNPDPRARVLAYYLALREARRTCARLRVGFTRCVDCQLRIYVDVTDRPMRATPSSAKESHPA